MCYESELRNSTQSRNHTLVRREFATATTAGQNAVDGGGDQRREVTGGDEDDPETRRDRAGCARAKGFGKTSIRLVLIQKFRVRFPPNSSQTDRVVEISFTDLA